MKKNTPKVEVLPIAKGATPDANNINKHTKKGGGLLENELRKRGAFRSIASAGKDTDVPVVYAGNFTLEKGIDAGFTEIVNIHVTGNQIVNVVRDDIAPNTAEAIALGISDNEIGKQSYNPDIDILASLAAGDSAILSALKKEDDIFGGMLDSMGIKEESADAEPQIEPDRYKEIAQKWKTKAGQLWAVGNHLIYCGDSLCAESVKVLFGNKIPALVIADPPYGVNIVATNGYVGGGESAKGMIPFGGRKGFGNVGGGASHIAKTGMSYMESNKRKRLRGSVGASKPFGSKAIRGTDGSTNIVETGKYPVIIGDESTDTARKAVKLYRDLFPDSVQVWWGGNYYSDALSPSMCWLVWNKETTGNFADCELAWTNQNKAARLFTHRWNGMLRESERERRWHPTQKPAVLAEWVFVGFTQEGDEVFDPFGGELCNRKARVIEKSPEYVAVCLERMLLKFPDIKIERIT